MTFDVQGDHKIQNGMMHQVVRSYFLLVSFALAAFLIGLFVTFQYKKQSKNIVEQQLPKTLMTIKMQSEVNQVLAALRGWIAVGEKSLRDEGRNLWENSIFRDLETLEESIKREDNTNSSTRIQHLKENLIKLREWHWYIGEAAQNGGNMPAHMLSRTHLKALFFSIEKMLATKPLRNGNENESVRIMYALSSIQNNILLFLQEPNPEALLNIRQQLDSFELPFTDNASNRGFSQIVNQPGEQLRREVVAYATIARRVLNLRMRDDWNKANFWLTTKAIPLANQIKDDLSMISAGYQVSMEQSSERLEQLGKTLIWSYAVSILLMIAFAILHGRYWIKNLIKPVGFLTDASKKLRSGELDQEIVWERHDEFGDLALSLDLMRRSLRKREEDLRSSKVRLDTVINTMIDGVIVVNRKGVILSVNKASCQLLDTKANFLLGGKLQNYIRHGEQQGIFCDDTNLVRSNDKFLELKVAKHQGGLFDAEIAVREMQLSGEVQYVVLLRDITERNAIEVAKSEFTSIVSHELRTPLTSIRGALGLLQGGVVQSFNQKAQSMIDIAVNNSDRLLSLINDMLDVEKLESGHFLLEKNWCKLSVLVEKGLESVLHLAEINQIRLTVQPSKYIASEVYIDEKRIVQVITNLLSNAIKVSPQNSEIFIKVENQPINQVKISIVDQGPGIPESFQPNIFNKFSQADSSATRKVEGSGLGLFITKNIVEQHGGRIGFNTSESGTEFFFILDTKITGKKDLFEKSRDPEYRALICDDEEDIARLIQFIAIEAGFQCDLCFEYAEVEKSLAMKTYDVLILDVMIGSDNALEKLPYEASNATPTIFISGKRSIEEYSDSQSAHQIYQWFQKPLQVAKVSETLGKIRNEKAKNVLFIEDVEGVSKLFVECLPDDYGYKVGMLEQALTLVGSASAQLLVIDIDLVNSSTCELIEKVAHAIDQNIIMILVSELSVPVDLAPYFKEVIVKSTLDKTTAKYVFEKYLK